MRFRHLVPAILTLAFFVPVAAARTPDDADHYSAFALFDDGYADVTHVDWANGTETVYVDVNLSRQTGAGLVLAIPAKPEEISTSWVKGMPQYRGRTPASKLHQQLDDGLNYSMCSQLYPFVFEAFFSPTLGYSAEIPDMPTIQITQDNLVVEVAPIAGPEQLHDLLLKDDITLFDNELRRMDALADGSHCFVLAHFNAPITPSAITNPPQLEKTCFLKLRFSSANAVVLARATGPDSGERMQVISLSGYMNLSAPTNGVRTLHYRGGVYNPAQPDVRDSVQFPYTRISYTGFPTELLLTPQSKEAFEKTDRQYALYTSQPVYYSLLILWTAACSYFCAGVAGLLTAHRWRYFSTLGLWNLATILAIIYKLDHRKWAERGLITKNRKRLFLLLFSASFISLNLLAKHIIYSSLGPYSHW